MNDAGQSGTPETRRGAEFGYAIIRLDTYPSADGMRIAVAIKMIVWDEREAEAEVRRLNLVNEERGAVYITKPARIQTRHN